MDESNSLLVFGNQMPAVHYAVLMVCYLLGFIMAGVGLYQLATGGEQGMRRYSHGLGLGVSALLIGALMMNLPVTLGAFTGTFFTGDAPLDPSILSRSGASAADPIGVWVKAIFNVLIVLGWIVAVWGLMNLGIAGSRREKGLSAGISRLCAAVILTNPYAFFDMLGASFGVLDTVQLVIPSRSP